MGTTTIAPERIAPIRNRRAMFVVLVGVAALTILDVSKVGVALPAIQASTGGSPSTIQLMLVGYTLAYAATLLPAGRLGDIVPRRRIFLLGTIVFMAASLACTFAPNVELLVAGRVVQGIGAGLLMPQVLGLIQRSFAPGERAKPLAILAATLSVTSLLGPVLAGAVIDLLGDELGWRALFLISVVAAGAMLPIAVRTIREPTAERRRGFDGIGTALLIVGVVLAIAPLSAISGSAPLHAWMIVATGVGAVALIAFMLHERRLSGRAREALVDPALFRLPHFSSGVLVSGCMHAAGTAGTLIVTIGLQQVGGLSALETALWMLPSAAASVLGSWIAGRVASTNGWVVILGTAMGALAMASIGIAFGATSGTSLAVIVAVVLAVSSFGSGLAAPSNQARTLLAVPDYRSSVGGSMIQFAQRIGSAIGMALALVLYYGFQFAPTSFGEGRLGPLLALLAVAAFLVAATATAVIDLVRERRRRAR